MAFEEGIVFKKTQNTVWVKTQRAKTCSHCEAKDDCQTMNSHMEEMEVEVDNTIGAQEGDLVMLSMPTGSLLQLSFLMYIVPIILMIIGGVLGQKIAPIIQWDETFCSVTFSLVCFALTIFGIRLLSFKLVKNQKYRPQISRIKPSHELSNCAQ